MAPGTTILMPDNLYFNVIQLMELVYQPLGIRYRQVDMSNIDAVQQAVDSDPSIGLLWVETPSNALLKVTSITDMCRIAKPVL